MLVCAANSTHPYEQTIEGLIVLLIFYKSESRIFYLSCITSRVVRMRPLDLAIVIEMQDLCR